ncbi:MAG: hypothetical protein J6T19_02290 [Paludibacteraceae bacterium]|nr:hypothetical protein [Paludibacteraceae bacterium]
MKSLKYLAAMCCAVLAFGLSSCQKETVQVVYSVGFSAKNQKASGDDFYNLCLYFQEKGVPYSGDDSIWRIEGNSVADCDAQALDRYNKQIAKLNNDEIAAFIQYPEDFYVDYHLAAGSSKEGESRILAHWIYPPAK